MAQPITLQTHLFCIVFKVLFFQPEGIFQIPSILHFNDPLIVLLVCNLKENLYFSCVQIISFVLLHFLNFTSVDDFRANVLHNMVRLVS